MGKGDRRNSNKMLRRRSRGRYKARMSRPRGLARAPIAERHAAEAAAKAEAAANQDDEGDESAES